MGDELEPVTLLEQNEVVRLDADRMDQLYQQFGDSGAEDVVCRALEHLAARLAHVEAAYQKENWDQLQTHLRSLGSIADQIGIQILSAVTADVANCIKRSDRVALAATLARLLRIGEVSLYEVWDLQDYSI